MREGGAAGCTFRARVILAEAIHQRSNRFVSRSGPAPSTAKGLAPAIDRVWAQTRIGGTTGRRDLGILGAEGREDSPADRRPRGQPAYFEFSFGFLNFFFERRRGRIRAGLPGSGRLPRTATLNFCGARDDSLFSSSSAEGLDVLCE